MPYLGATKPKPAGTITRSSEGRALVWDPRRPLPGLHEGSWETKRKDHLLLLGKGPGSKNDLPPRGRPLDGEGKDFRKR